MDPSAPDGQDPIAAIAPHAESAIGTSPYTCGDLRLEPVLEMATQHGLGPNRISSFSALSAATRAKFRLELSRKRRDPKLSPIINKAYHTKASADDVPRRNELINSMLQECDLVDIALECETVAVSYTAALRYLWTQSKTLTRYTGSEDELESMLETMLLRSICHRFVSASITSSPWFTSYPISYTIRVTDAYRRRAFPLTYTSVFAVDRPEITRGFKQYWFFEDEVRIENDTPIEPGTVDITVHPSAAIPASRIESLTSKYALLGKVRALS